MADRQTEMQRAAYELNLTYFPKDEWGLLRLLRDFKLFRKGGRRRMSHLLQKKDGLLEMNLHIFDYQYTISTGKTSHTYKQTVFFVESKKLALPEFWMKPENFFHKIGAWLGIEDIDFDAFPEFSNQYYLKGKDKEAVRDMMDNRVLHFFTVNKDWYLEGVNYYMIFYKDEQLLSSGQIYKFFNKGMELYRMLSAQNDEPEMV